MGTSPRRPPTSKTPPRQPVNDPVTLSFRHFRERVPFVTDAVSGNYLSALLGRFYAVRGMTVKEMKESRGLPLRCHSIRFGETSQPGGFGHVDLSSLEGTEPYQFSVTSNQHGRVHGFFVSNVFYVVWVDPHRALYPQRG